MPSYNPIDNTPTHIYNKYYMYKMHTHTQQTTKTNINLCAYILVDVYIIYSIFILLYKSCVYGINSSYIYNTYLLYSVTQHI